MKYSQIQLWWLSCKAREYTGRLDELTSEFNKVFKQERTRKAIETVMHKNGIHNRYFGHEQKMWLMSHMGKCTWQELTDRYNDIFGENRTRKSIICVCRRIYDKQRVS